MNVLDATPGISIDHLDLTYLVPRGEPRPWEFAGRTDRMMRERFPALCGAQLADFDDPSDPSIWFIRSIEAELILSVTQPEDDKIARSCAEATSLAIRAKLARGPDGHDVVFFADLHAFLAEFLCDVACGQAWGKWVYGTFSGLRHLPAGSAIRTLLQQHSRSAAQILRDIAKSDRLDDVLETLSTGEAMSVFETLFAGSNGSDAAPGWEEYARLLDAWPEASLLRRSNGSFNTPQNAIRLFLGAAHRADTLDQRKTGKAILRLLEFVDWPPTPDADEPPSGVEWPPDLAAEAAHRLGCLLPAAAWERLEEIRRNEHPIINVTEASSSVALHSSYPGIWLLLPAFLELVDRSGSNDSPETALLQFFRYALALKWIGASRAADAVSDPAVLLFAGLSCAPSAEPTVPPAEALEKLGTTLITSIGLRLARTGRLDFERVGLRFVSAGDGQRLILLQDVNSGFWFYGRLVPDRASESEIASMCAEARETFGLATDFADAAECDGWHQYFSLRGVLKPLAESQALDVVWSVVADTVMRSFAHQLFGFHRSSAEHLYENFLSGRGVIRLAEHIAIDIPQPPLHLVLRLGGLDEQTIYIPWLGREVKLSFPSE